MIFSIVRKEFLVILRERGTFFWLFLLPILFILLFGTVFGGDSNTQFTVHYVDQDRSAASTNFIQALGKINGVVLVADTADSVQEQVNQIKIGKLTSLLVISQGFGANLQAGTTPAALTFYSDATASASVAPVHAMLQNIASGYRDGKVSAALASTGKSGQDIGQILAAPIQIQDVKENAVKVNGFTQAVPGNTVMFVFYIMATMLSRFLQEKDSGITARLRSTTLTPLQYLIGMWIPNVVVVLIQCAVLLTFGHFWFHLYLGDLRAASLLIVCLAICATSCGLALAMLVNSQNAGMLLAQILAMGGAVLGGLWMPLDIMPTAIQSIARFTPQHWAMKGLQDVMLRGAHIQDLMLPFFVLIAVAVLAVLVATLRFKRFLLSAAK